MNTKNIFNNKFLLLNIKNKQNNRRKTNKTRKVNIQTQKKYKYDNIYKNVYINNYNNDNLSTLLTDKEFLDRIKKKCSSSNICLLFGIDVKYIKKFFNNFVKFDYVNNMEFISYGGSGFIIRINYEKMNYKSSAILKSSKSKNSDNLYYEYLVGLFLNKYIEIYPCFLETYGLFLYTDYDWNNIMEQFNIFYQLKHKSQQKEGIIANNIILNIKQLIQITSKDMKINIKRTCEESSKLSLLIQSLNNTIKLKTFITNRDIYFINEYILFEIFYQIYGPLSFMSNIYTHYDLHDDNILLYVFPNEYLIYNYHRPDNTILTFKSSSIVKIIDYGRSYINNNGYTTMDYHKELCKEISCEPDCGSKVGYSLFNNDNDIDNDYVNPTYNNISSDLRLLFLIKKYIGEDMSILKNFLNKVIYNTFYGTKEIKINTINDGNINNIIDAENEIRNIMTNKVFKLLNDKNYESKKHIGTFNIFLDGSKKMDFKNI